MGSDEVGSDEVVARDVVVVVVVPGPGVVTAGSRLVARREAVAGTVEGTEAPQFGLSLGKWVLAASERNKAVWGLLLWKLVE